MKISRYQYIREKSNKASFCLRDLLSKVQHVFGGEKAHNAICQKNINGEYFDLVRKFDVSWNMELSLLFYEDLKKSTKGFYFELSRDVSQLGFDISEIKIRSRSLNYVELRDILNALMYIGEKEQFINALKNNEIRALNKEKKRYTTEFLKFNDFFDEKIEFFILSNDELTLRLKNYFLNKKLGKNTLLEMVEDFEKAYSKKKEEFEKLDQELDLKEVNLLSDPEYLMLLKQRDEIEEKIAEKEKELRGFNNTKKDELALLQNWESFSLTVNKENLERGNLMVIGQAFLEMKGLPELKSLKTLKKIKNVDFLFLNLHDSIFVK